ncbi:MAG: glycosyltransferase family 2 protein [Candidatus Gracilibacteria bacterium]|nr:glycosyltransferase family 2 protein [Candidatus Gracilibacteria bacterium]
MKNKISVIIPAYFEEKSTINTVNDLLNISKNIELLIVYKGEKYNYISEQLNKMCLDIKLIEVNGKSTRSIFMNIGAKQSTGDILLFLHNDTILPINYFEVLSILDLSKYNYGGFYKQFYPNNFFLALNSTLTNIRLRLFGSLLGDNSIFISSKLFKKIGGFADLSLMEDVEISKKLKKYGKIFIIKNKTITSSKKFQKNGTIKTIIFMIYLRFLYLLGVDTKLLKEKYSKY